MSFFDLKKHREFNLKDRLHPDEDKTKRIKFDRLPRKKVKPIWFLIILFAVVIYLIFFLDRF